MSGSQSVITEKKAELKQVNANREVLLWQISNLEADAKNLVSKPAKKLTTPAAKAGKKK